MCMCCGKELESYGIELQKAMSADSSNQQSRMYVVKKINYPQQHHHLVPRFGTISTDSAKGRCYKVLTVSDLKIQHIFLIQSHTLTVSLLHSILKLRTSIQTVGGGLDFLATHNRQCLPSASPFSCYKWSPADTQESDRVGKPTDLVYVVSMIFRPTKCPLHWYRQYDI